MSPRSSVSYRGLPLPRALGNLVSHPGAFLASVFALVFLLAIKVLLVRNRPADHEVER